MSSRKVVATVKRASGTPRHLVVGDAMRAASDEGMSRNDKLNFIRAMADGLTPKPAAVSKKAGVGAASTRTSKLAAGNSATPPSRSQKVVLVRKIPAPVKPEARPTNPLSEAVIAVSQQIEAANAAGDLEALTPDAVQALMRAMAKFYSANMDAGNKYPLVANRLAISGTDAMIVCSALLKSVDLQVFELGMWQSWSGI